MSNIYYSPEEFGLTLVAEIDFSDGYDFDKICIWKSMKGRMKLYWAADSGCSCPSPFENYHSVDALDVLNARTWKDFENAVMNSVGYSSGRTSDKMRFLREGQKIRGKEI